MVDFDILFGDGMGADDDFHSEFRRDQTAEIIQVGTGRISDDESGGEVNDFHPVFAHFFGGIFEIPAGAASAGGVACQFDFLSLVDGESSFPVAERSETFPAGAGMVTVADDDTEFYEVTHSGSDYRV